MGTVGRRRTLTGAAALALAAAGALVPTLHSAATTAAPSIRLFSATHEATITRFPDEHYMYLELGVYAASVGGAFELDVTRVENGLHVEQVDRDGDTVTPVRTLPNVQGSGFDVGLARFFHLTWTGISTNTVAQSNAPFCPGGFDVVRTDDSGPLQPTYPYWCGGSPLTQATVWGVDRGWASQALSSGIPSPDIPDGTYQLSISIGKAYADALELTDNAPVDLTVTLQTARGCGYGPAPVKPCPYGPVARERDAAEQATEQFNPAISTPGPLPDLRTLPAWDIHTHHEKTTGRDILSFAATVWNGGDGPMLVEGYRQTDVPEMPVTQYFLGPDGVTSEQQVGFFVFDDQRGHHHWHFDDFARYELYDVAKGTTTMSGKRSFCIAPTDPVDLLAPGADWQPDRIGLYSACGGPGAVWIREVLPAGWGDTYVQWRAGQAFNITHVPNGRYDLRIVANPAGNLIESDTTNNVSTVHLRLGGPAGHRTVQILTS